MCSSRRSASAPKRSWCSSMSFSTVAGSGRAPGRKSRGGLENLAGPAQLGVLLAQSGEFLLLGAGQPVVAFASVGLVLADPVAQGLVVHAQVPGHLPDHRFRVGGSVCGNGSLTQLGRVLHRCSHGRGSLLATYQVMSGNLPHLGGTSSRTAATTKGQPRRIPGELALRAASPLSGSNRRPPLYKSGALAS